MQGRAAAEEAQPGGTAAATDAAGGRHGHRTLLPPGLRCGWAARHVRCNTPISRRPALVRLPYVAQVPGARNGLHNGQRDKEVTLQQLLPVTQLQRKVPWLSLLLSGQLSLPCSHVERQHMRQCVA